MPNKIPTTDSASMPGYDENVKRRDALELDRLETELNHAKAVTHEIRVSVVIKQVAVGVGILVVLVLFAVLGFAICRAIWMPSGFRIDNVAVAIALIVAPITSITAIVIALFIGAFRKFNERDIQTAGRRISEVVMKTSGNLPGS